MRDLLRAAAARRLLPLFAAGLMTACAAPQASIPGGTSWSGRLALQVDSAPPQSFSASFDLHGSPQAGDLQITSPLGTTLASVHWAPGWAELRQGEHITHRTTLEELTTDLGGTALPIAALFAWLKGQPLEVAGWQADLSRHPEGRVIARRIQPQPSAELRIVFQP